MNSKRDKGASPGVAALSDQLSRPMSDEQRSELGLGRPRRGIAPDSEQVVVASDEAVALGADLQRWRDDRQDENLDRNPATKRLMSTRSGAEDRGLVSRLQRRVPLTQLVLTHADLRFLHVDGGKQARRGIRWQLHRCDLRFASLTARNATFTQTLLNRARMWFPGRGGESTLTRCNLHRARLWVGPAATVVLTNCDLRGTRIELAPTATVDLQGAIVDEHTAIHSDAEVLGPPDVERWTIIVVAPRRGTNHPARR